MNRGEFAREVFKRIKVEANGKTLTFAQAWMAYENTDAKNNPFATTQPWNNATEFNSVGVRNYATVEDGIAATVATLENGYYNHLMYVLRKAGSSPKEMWGALNASPWGSYVYQDLFEDVEHNYAQFNVEVPGSSGGVVPANTPPNASDNGIVVVPPEEPEPKPETNEPASEPTIQAVVPSNESEVTVDNETQETPAVDTLESRLAKLRAEQYTAVEATDVKEPDATLDFTTEQEGSQA